MILVLGVWACVRALLGNSAAVSLENAVLHHQLAVLQTGWCADQLFDRDRAEPQTAGAIPRSRAAGAYSRRDLTRRARREKVESAQDSITQPTTLKHAPAREPRQVVYFFNSLT